MLAVTKYMILVFEDNVTRGVMFCVLTQTTTTVRVIRV